MAPVFIIGGGPSLNGFDWNRLKGEITIGINRAVDKIDPSIWLSMDGQFTSWARNGWAGEAARNREKLNCLPIYYSHTGVDVYGYVRADGGNHKWGYLLHEQLARCNNSGLASLQIACCLTDGPIYLLGIDMIGENGRQAWWHDGYRRVQDDTCYTKFIKRFEKYAPTINRSHRVINLNPDSGLRCFPFDRIENIPQRRRPIVVSFYTKGTAYEAEARRMVRSVHLHGLEHDVREVPNQGSWLANTAHKPQYLRTMLDIHAGRDILWIDADGEMRHYPVLFDDFTADIGVCYVDWPQYGRNRGPELLSGTIYLKNNRRVRDLVDEWARRIERKPQWDQRVLQEIIPERQGLKVIDLPDTYTQIFDTMKNAGEPVILHHQASRRLKKEVGV